MTKFKKGETVFVPKNRIDLPDDGHSAFYKTEVQDVIKRSITVSLPGGQISRPIGSSAVHKDIGILCVNIGDFETELTLLNPLSKSILQFLRLILPDDFIFQYSVRSLTELGQIWGKHHRAITHVIIIGHGSENTIQFGVDGSLIATQITTALSLPDVEPKIFISLCCQTGHENFGNPFSQSDLCLGLVAPLQSVHGAIASQFCQTLLTYHLLHGESLGVAFKHSLSGVAGRPDFRLWQKGTQKGSSLARSR
jgi:hypothetical protein